MNSFRIGDYCWRAYTVDDEANLGKSAGFPAGRSAGLSG